jgi:hypothetical protein
MGGFKESVARDIGSVFFNLGEFAETHDVGGRKIPIVLAADEWRRRLGDDAFGESWDGLGMARASFYARESDLGAPPRRGQIVELDGERFKTIGSERFMGAVRVDLGAIRE